LLAEPLGELLSQQPRHDVLRTAGRKAYDPAHWARGIGLRTRKARHRRQHRRTGSEMQKVSTRKSHAILPRVEQDYSAR
jgi:hypothetical protein